MQIDILEGKWFVSDWALEKAAVVELGGSAAEVRWLDKGRRVESLRVSDWLWDASQDRGDFTAAADGKTAAAWLRMSGQDEAVGGQREGGALVRARRVSAVPAAVQGQWQVIGLASRRSRKVVGWKATETTVSIVQSSKTVDFETYCVASDEASMTLVMADPKGDVFEVRAWSVGAAAWLVCETDQSNGYVLYQGDPPAPWAGAADREDDD